MRAWALILTLLALLFGLLGGLAFILTVPFMSDNGQNIERTSFLLGLGLIGGTLGTVLAVSGALLVLPRPALAQWLLGTAALVLAVGLHVYAILTVPCLIAATYLAHGAAREAGARA